MVKCTILVFQGKEARNEVDAFYEKHGRVTRARDSDTFFIAESPGGVIGSVRFCIEETIPMLRGMFIDENFRKLGLGRRLLKEFEAFLNENSIKNTHCLPYPYLEKFYASIGFRKIDVGIPKHLEARMEEYKAKNIEVICMKRP